MGLKNLTESQTIIIDDHKRGSKEKKDWDDPKIDIHIDKKTDYPLKGKKQEVRIRVPINSERPVKVTNAKNNDIGEIPRRLYKEIQSAFSGKATRQTFMGDLVGILRNCSTILVSVERVQQV